MQFNKLRAISGSSIAFAFSALFVGCGGGGASDAPTQDMVASSTTSAASGNDVGITQSASASSASSVSAGAGDPSSTGSAQSTSPAASSTDATDSVPQSSTNTSAVSASRSGVGTNLTQVSYYSTEYPTIDFMKRAGGWLTQCSAYVNKDCKTSPWDSGEQAQLDLDADGWVKSLPDTGASSAYRYVSTIINSGGAQPVGKYVVLYDGQGTLSYGGAGSKVVAESAPGRDIVSVTNGTGAFLLSILATTPSNYVRNIRIYAPGGACSGDLTTYVLSASACAAGKGSYLAFENFPTGSTWFPSFLNEVKGFRTLRFMDWGQTNTSKVTSWAKRTSSTARTWASNAGVPVESMFDLAKNAGADPWMNLPPYVDDEYIHQFGKLAHEKLAAGQTLNLEYANEMWNYAFPATIWAVAQAKLAFPASVAKGVDQNSLLRNFYAQRLTTACNIVKAEFGVDAARVRCVANTMAANSWDATQVLSCPYAGGACAKSIDVLAIAPYFGSYIADSLNRPTVTTWYTDADGGLSKMFEEILGTEARNATNLLTPLAATAKAPGGALAGVKKMMIANSAVASKYGVALWAYEGGQSLMMSASDTDTKLLNVMVAANRDSRMGAAYTTMLQDWVAAGGQTFALFTDVTPNSKYGFWGMRETQFDSPENAPKWKVALQWRDATACWWAGC